MFRPLDTTANVSLLKTVTSKSILYVIIYRDAITFFTNLKGIKMYRKRFKCHFIQSTVMPALHVERCVRRCRRQAHLSSCLCSNLCVCGKYLMTADASTTNPFFIGFFFRDHRVSARALGDCPHVWWMHKGLSGRVPALFSVFLSFYGYLFIRQSY